VTLERRHQMDMLQTYKILSGQEKVDPSSWFSMASDSERVTRQSADPLNIRPGTPRLDIRRYFYSQRVIDVTCGGNTGQQHLQSEPTGTNEDQQPSNPSK